MRKKIVDGVSYECPMYLVRAGDGWQIRPPGLSTRYFADNLYGGVGAGLWIAISIGVILAGLATAHHFGAFFERRSHDE